ncbi:hypothetical protein C5167_004104 [Papaver somniferum]|nr:hypothetical protein C5167_004104 [Papaver somniferum]
MILKEKEEDENADTYSEFPSEKKIVYAKRVVRYLGAVSMVKNMGLSPFFLESNITDVGDDWEAGLSLPGMLSHLNAASSKRVRQEQFKDKLRASSSIKMVFKIEMPFDGCCSDCERPGDDCPLIWGSGNSNSKVMWYMPPLAFHQFSGQKFDYIQTLKQFVAEVMKM